MWMVLLLSFTFTEFFFHLRISTCRGNTLFHLCNRQLLSSFFSTGKQTHSEIPTPRKWTGGRTVVRTCEPWFWPENDTSSFERKIILILRFEFFIAFTEKKKIKTMVIWCIPRRIVLSYFVLFLSILINKIKIVYLGPKRTYWNAVFY